MRRTTPIAMKRSQQGITLVLISLIMLILIGMGALAMDLNHQVLNKARLQNAVDSAALASAVVADETSDVVLAEAAANEALLSFVTASGNDELSDNEVVKGNISITFSNTKQVGSFVIADDFELDITDGDDDIYVRVVVSDVSLTQYLSSVFGIGKNVSASAVAGRSAPIVGTCNVSPIAMCGDMNMTDEEGDATVWGYIPNSNYNAKTDRLGSTVHIVKPADNKSGELGPGNFQLLDLGLNGADGIRDAFAGDTNICIAKGEVVDTQTGKATGPVAQGVNTRFDQFNGPTEEDEVVKSDLYTRESDVNADNYESIYDDSPENTELQDDKAFYYADYHSELMNCSEGGTGDNCTQYYHSNGSEGRRVLRVPIIDCSTATEGKSQVEVIGLGCFFLTQKVKQQGNDSEVFGQFLEDCYVENAFTDIEPDNSEGLYKIQLYKDPEGGAS